MRASGLSGSWDQIPMTIGDAIRLLQMMGLRCLWVYSLCLVQDDREDMARGIYMMDTIYEQSLFTLIAASDNDTNNGIPGIRGGSRKVTQMICEVVPGIHLLVVHENGDSSQNEPSTIQGRGREWGLCVSEQDRS